MFQAGGHGPAGPADRDAIQGEGRADASVRAGK